MGKHQPALLGGLFIGVLSSLPVISIANCCCLWVLAGGVLVVYLQQQNTPVPVITGDAAIGGLIAGAVGGLIVCIVQMLTMKAAALTAAFCTTACAVRRTPCSICSTTT